MLGRALIPLFLLALTTGAQAQNWPDRPIRFVVTQAAGGTPDIIARLIGEKLGKALGQQVVVENRPGAGNVIGAQAVARAAPDGYTFLFATAAALVTNPHTFKSLPYDAEKDFVPVGFVARAPFFVMVHPSVEAKTAAGTDRAGKGQARKPVGRDRRSAQFLRHADRLARQARRRELHAGAVHGDAAGHPGRGRRPRAGGDPGCRLGGAVHGARAIERDCRQRGAEGAGLRRR